VNEEALAPWGLLRQINKQQHVCQNIRFYQPLVHFGNKYLLTQLKNFPDFIEPKGSLLCSQVLATRPFPGPDKAYPLPLYSLL